MNNTGVSESSKFDEAREAMRTNNPPVKPMQVWSAHANGKIIRRIRIMAKHPRYALENYWIYEELAGGILRTEIGRLGICPEFNLRYVFELEGHNAE